ncbi:hypothetical protein BDZ94DRAFT_535538 [Collybia nuda]|uniref:Uncharacterized protein n=1 Tax=Collybia nuda TaxID=64659 RepID=A0A9P5Y955_9AGAR|nr:hypothetical protein BDZ94DRAFT_535538 [Collybia nuda]
MTVTCYVYRGKWEFVGKASGLTVWNAYLISLICLSPKVTHAYILSARVLRPYRGVCIICTETEEIKLNQAPRATVNSFSTLTFETCLVQGWG